MTPSICASRFDCPRRLPAPESRPQQAAQRPIRRVLILAHALSHEGGVSNYYRILLSHWEALDIALAHLSIGSSPHDFYAKAAKALKYIVTFTRDCIRLSLTLLSDKSIEVVQVSPSLIPVALVRDGVFLLLGHLLGRKVVVFFRGWRAGTARRLRSNSLRSFLFRSVYRRADLTFALAESIRSDLSAAGLDRNRIQVETTMIDESLYSETSPPAEGPARFVFLSRVSKKKGVDLLIAAAAQLASAPVQYSVWVLGHAERIGDIEQFRRQAQRLGIDDRVHFAGRVDAEDKVAQLAAGDVFVLPSLEEGMPTVILEALACGLYVIASDVGAVSEVLSQPILGCTVPPRDSRDLARAMLASAHRLPWIRQTRAARRQSAVSRFGSRNVLPRLLSSYRKLLQ